jgi:hypothetical protein
VPPVEGAPAFAEVESPPAPATTVLAEPPICAVLPPLAALLASGEDEQAQASPTNAEEPDRRRALSTREFAASEIFLNCGRASRCEMGMLHV